MMAGEKARRSAAKDRLIGRRQHSTYRDRRSSGSSTGLPTSLGVALDRVQRGEARRDFPRGEDLNLELIVSSFRGRLGENFAAAKERVERLWKARCKSPFKRGY
jgi:hypothetical protein